MHWRRQGDLGELSAMEWFAAQGAAIAVPVGHSPDWDFIAELDDRLVRVQVKTCICFRAERWNVQLSTRGGNRSWTGTIKHLDSARCDRVFVVVGDGRRWSIPSHALDAGSHITLGGPKYSEFEVEPGRPLPGHAGQYPVSTIGPPDPRGDVRAAKGDAL
jgi:PD-(D/E)XK endonuclease